MKSIAEKMMREEKEIKITKEIAEEIMGSDNFIESAKLQANCHDCIYACVMGNTRQRSIKMKVVSEYFLDSNGNIILKGVCNACGGNNCVSCIACSTGQNKRKIAMKYLIGQCDEEKISRQQFDDLLRNNNYEVFAIGDHTTICGLLTASDFDYKYFKFDRDLIRKGICPKCNEETKEIFILGR